MSGLEDILDSIRIEAEKEAFTIIKDAEKSAENIILDAEKAAKVNSSDIISKANKQAEALLSKELSSTKLKKKSIILKARYDAINNLIEDAKKSIINLKAESYFAVILKMVEKFATSQKGEIVFSKKDKNRITEKFTNELLRTMNFKGGSLKISENTREIDGGFILIYGNIEENCSFEALFESAKENVFDVVNNFLFSQIEVNKS